MGSGESLHSPPLRRHYLVPVPAEVVTRIDPTTRRTQTLGARSDCRGARRGRREAPPPPKDVALQDVPQFQLDVLPTFNQFCVKCHSQNDSHAGLRLDSHAQLMKGSSRGLVVIPGDAGNSILLRALKQDPRLAMPFHGQKLPPNRIANIERWISQGAGNN